MIAPDPTKPGARNVQEVVTAGGGVGDVEVRDRGGSEGERPADVERADGTNVAAGDTGDAAGGGGSCCSRVTEPLMTPSPPMVAVVELAVAVTVTAEAEASEPSTIRAPLLTVVVPV